MKTKILARPRCLLGMALAMVIAAGCENSSVGGLSLRDIPLYPGATEGQSMAQSSPFGIVGGELKQFTTTDSYDEVLEFYSDALSGFSPEVRSHKSELGRQTGISIPRKNGMITVAVQEFIGEEAVNITFMSVGR